jgi:hypothetical protein
MPREARRDQVKEPSEAAAIAAKPSMNLAPAGLFSHGRRIVPGGRVEIPETVMTERPTT